MSLKNIILIAVLFFYLNNSAQPWVTQITDTSTGYSIQNLRESFTTFWKGTKPEKGSGYNVFNRWLEFNEVRAGMYGKLPTSGQLAKNWESFLFQQKYTNSLRGSFDSGNWVSVGPTTTSGGYDGIGRVNCITFHPTDSNTFYIGAPAGGIWVTKDYGKNWKPLGDKIPSMGVSDIAIDYTNTSVIYIATGDRDFGSLGGVQGLSGTGDTKGVGIMKSSDGGITWRYTGLVFSIPNMDKVNRLIIHPKNHKTLFAATTNGFYISNDSGYTWTKKRTGYYIDMEVNPANPNIIYIASYGSSAQIYKSTNGGNTFTTVTAFSGVNRINIETALSDASIIMAIASDNSNNSLEGIYKSTDSGSTFTQVMAGDPSSGTNILGSNMDGTSIKGQGWYDLAFAIHPKNPDIVFAGGVNSWRSNDGGASWELINFWTSGSSVQTVHADKHVLQFHPISKNPAGRLFEGNDGGLYYTKDNGDNWILLANGLIIGQIYRIASSKNGDYILAGHQDNGTKMRTTSTSKWDDVNGGDGMNCQIDQGNSSYMYAGVQYGKIMRTSDKFSSWSVDISANISGNSQGAWVTPYILDPNNQSTIYAGYQDVYKSTNRGNSWSKISTGLTGSNNVVLRTLAMSEKYSNFIIAAGFYGIWKTNNSGSKWTSIYAGLPTSNAITGVLVHPTDTSKLWVVFSGYDSGKKVYKSVDAGKNWVNFSGSLPNFPVNCISIESGSTDNNLYIGTDIGVFVRNDKFSDWVFFSRNLPVVPVTDLDLNLVTKKITAGTHGRGLWQSNFWYSTPPPAPVADFSLTDSAICVGENITFTNLSSNQTGLQWYFSGGIPSASNDTTPTIQYPNPGRFKVTLIASGIGGIDTLLIDSFIIVYSKPQLPVITQDTNRLISSYSSNLQWYKDGNKLAGETQQTLEAKTDGVYRVEFTDSNGCTSISIPLNFKYTRIGMARNLNEGHFKIYPNPTSNELHLDFNDDIKISNCYMADINGRFIHNLTITNRKISLPQIATGLYLIVFMDENNIKYYNYLLINYSN